MGSGQPLTMTAQVIDSVGQFVPHSLAIARDPPKLGIEMSQRVENLGLVVEERTELVVRERAWSMRVATGEFSLSGHSGLVDPASRQGLGEDIDGGFLAGRRDECVVVMSTSGHRHIDASDICSSVEDEDRSVDRAALGRMSGVGVAEVDVFCDVVGG